MLTHPRYVKASTANTAKSSPPTGKPPYGASKTKNTTISNINSPWPESKK